MVLHSPVIFLFGALVCAGLAVAVWRRAPGQPSALGLGLAAAAVSLGLLASGEPLLEGGAGAQLGAVVLGLFVVPPVVRAFQPAAFAATPAADLLPRVQQALGAVAGFFLLWIWPLQASVELGRVWRDAEGAKAGWVRVEGDSLSGLAAGAIVEVEGAACVEGSSIVVRVSDGERGAPRVWKPLRVGKGEAVPALVTGDCGAPLRVEVLGPLHRSDRAEAERAKVRLAEGAVGLRALRVTSAEGLAEAGLVALAEVALRALVVGLFLPNWRLFQSAAWRRGR